MRILLDTDIILDLLLDRAPFADDAAELWKANEQGRYEAYISIMTPVNVFYVARKLKGRAGARQAVVNLLAALRVCALDQVVLQSALTLPFADYEDAVQHASATSSLLDGIVTRNLKDYAAATLPVFSPPDFLKLLPPGSQPQP